MVDGLTCTDNDVWPLTRDRSRPRNLERDASEVVGSRQGLTADLREVQTVRHRAEGRRSSAFASGPAVGLLALAASAQFIKGRLFVLVHLSIDSGYLTGGLDQVSQVPARRI